MTRRFGLGDSWREGLRFERGKTFAHEPSLGLDEHRLLRDLIAERLGILFGIESRSSLERRLRPRLTVRGVATFADYYQLLKFGAVAEEEWAEATELLATHETYFFREDYQLRSFRDELLPMFAERLRGRRRLQIWSAGCSTGEEAYTIAILLLESGLFDGWDVRVYGSDLSKRCIATARRGLYGASSFRATDPSLKERWFIPAEATEGGAMLLGPRPEVRALCHFGQLNMLDDERTHLVGRCDLIFCRNVLIYFDGQRRRRVIDMFHQRLHAGGVLLLGHAESLLNVTTAFELLHLKEDLVYRKPSLESGAPPSL